MIRKIILLSGLLISVASAQVQPTKPTTGPGLVSVLSVPGTVCDNVTDVSPAVNKLVTAGNINILIPKNCIYYPTSGVTPAGVSIQGEDPRSSVIAVTNPGTTNLFLGPYASVHHIGIIDEFCQVTVTPANTAKTCPLAGDQYNSTGINQNLATWSGQGFACIGGNYVTPDGSASTTIDVPCVSVDASGAGGDALYAASTNTTGFGTSAIRVVTAGTLDNGIYILNGGQSPSVRHFGVWAQDFNNQSNSSGHLVQLSRIGDATGVAQTMIIEDSAAAYTAGSTDFLDINPSHQSTGNLFAMFQSTTPFSGTDIFLNNGNASGTFTGKFVDFFNGGTEEFKVDSAGNMIVNGTSTHNGTVSMGQGSFNYMTATGGAATGNPPVLASAGGDTNVDLDLNSKGTGKVITNGAFTSSGTFTATIGGFMGGATGFQTLSGASNGLYAQGTNTPIYLSSSGTGVVGFKAGTVSSGTAFTIAASSCGTTAVTGLVAGAQAGTFVAANSGSCIFTMTINGATGTVAPHGWICGITDVTTGVAGVPSTVNSTTTCAAKVTVGATTDTMEMHVQWGY